jgi:hypothetical protein
MGQAPFSRVMSSLRLPFQALALASGAKSFRDNPLIGSQLLNGWGLHVSRVRLAQAMADWRRRHLTSLLDESDVAAYQRDGYIVKPDFLPKAQFETLRAEVLNCRSPARDMIQGDAVTRWVAPDKSTLAGMPTYQALIANPYRRALFDYVGASRFAQATVIQTIFARVRESDDDPQTALHADTFHPTAKSWLFLTDVAEDEGPFVYVPGSHRASPERLSWEHQMAMGIGTNPDFLSTRGSLRVSSEALQAYGFAAPRRLAVPANTLVIADTFGFHARGRSARPAVRAEIWTYGRRNPFLPWTGLDLASLPLLRDNPVTAYWALLDMRQRIGGRKSPWRLAGPVGPLAKPDLSIHQ